MWYRLFSFRSFNIDNHYLRHQDFRLKLHNHVPGDRLFEEDATFAITPSLAFIEEPDFMHFVSFRRACPNLGQARPVLAREPLRDHEPLYGCDPAAASTQPCPP
ncbi:AbfB domain-containing protein [Nonomuraea sp. NPDC049152]|uniref:AbfB domain-containing protein n=1 Tax=Nonomuraea sp. NPDC049152 TaxID=3154350 RepID=UPI0033D6438B